MADGGTITTETRLARLEALPDALERIERAVTRLGDKLESLHRIEQQQASHDQALGRAFKAIEKVTEALDGTRAQLTARVTSIEQTFAERMGWARGTISMAGAILGLAQIVVCAGVGYLFSHLGAAETALAERSKVDALFEQRLSVIERQVIDAARARL